MASLFGQTWSNRYKDVVQLNNTGSGVSASLITVQDGNGSNLPFQISTTALNVTGTFKVGGFAVSVAAAVTFGSTVTTVGAFSTAGAFSMVGAFTFAGTLTGNTAITYPTSGTLATLAGSETFTNKTIVLPNIADSGDNTKQLRYSLSGATTGFVTTFGFAHTANRTITFPDATDTLVGKATTDTFTNKTFDTAGAGNIFKVNGTSITDKTGTGKVVLDTSPTLTSPTLGAASATTVNKVTITTPATGSTLTIADGKTLTASNTLTFTGTDSSSVAFGTGGTVSYLSGASQTDMTTATSTTKAVTPAVAKYAPGVAKFWVSFTGAGTINGSYNVSSVTRNAAGNYTVNLTTAFNSTNNMVLGSSAYYNLAALMYTFVAYTSNSCQPVFANNSNTGVDPGNAFVFGYGTQ